MDDLYGDLENYNEVNIVEELRDENKQLKLKLEEYETAIGKLQKSLLQDYDKLTTEFHNLQTNYSSLLKTARAEVERKTQIITQLNLANDVKVLQSLQSNNKRKPLSRSRFQKNVQSENKANNIDVFKNEKTFKNDHKPKKDVRNEGCATSSVSTNISVPSYEKTKLNIIDKVVSRVENCITRGELKENISHCNTEHEGTTNVHAKIINKRKSVSLDVVPKFSSDDESESGNPTSHERRRDILPVGSSVTSRTRVTHDSLSTKTSETSSIDGRSYNIQDEARYSNRNRTSRDYENDKYKESDRSRKTDRTRSSDRLKVGDRYRESEKYKENENFRVVDRHRESDRYRESDRFRYDKFSAKDKHDYRYRKSSPDRSRKRSFREYQDDYYRPEYERKKQELPQYHQYRYEDDRYKHRYEERPTSKTYDEPNKRQKKETQIHFEEDKICHDKQASEYDMLRASCQSPDTQVHPTETHTEAIITHTVKEIKNTAAIPLEDPRVASKKYILETDNGKTILRTAVSQSIDIKPVDKSLWNIEAVTVPDALLCHTTSNITDDNLRDLVTIEDLNESIESGEICCDSEVANSTNVNVLTKKRTSKDNLDENTSEVALNPKSKEEHVEKIKTGYKIPKLKQGKRNVEKDCLTDKTISPKQDTYVRQLNVPHIDVLEDVVTSKFKKSSDDKSSQLLFDMAIVQDDLELSDETSDYIDRIVSDEKAADKIQQQQHEIHNASDKLNPSVEVVSEEIIQNSGTKSKEVGNKSKEYDGHKKHKIKRKKTKSKEIELSESTDTSTEKKKSKKDKESKSKEIKTTFSDLFGDSSSLITPEDLGMPASYIPLCEDVQEAMDINIKDVVKTPLAGVDTEKNCTTANVESTNDTDVNNLIIKDKDVEKIEENKMCPDPPIPQPILTGPQLDSDVVYQSLDQNISDKTNVVKTVIISSGVQPQLVLGDETSEKRVVDVEVNIQNVGNNNHITDIKNQPSSKALATSTPYKELSTSAQADSGANESLSDSNNSNTESIDRTASNNSKLATNTQCSYDPPDVRIFVKRRRKGVKRT